MGGSPYCTEEQDMPIHLLDLNLHIAPICDGREPGPCRGGILNLDCDPPPPIEANQTHPQHNGTKGNKHVNATEPTQTGLTARLLGRLDWTGLASRLPAPSQPRLALSGRSAALRAERCEMTRRSK